MRMKDNALDYYDRNCFDCEHREPVGLPNLTELLEERERERAESRRRREAEEAEATRSLNERNAEYASLREGASQDQLALLNLIQAVDQHPSKDSVETLLEGIAAAPDAASSHKIVSALEILHSGRGKERTTGALTALDQLPYSRQKLLGLSLVALSRGDEVDISFDIVADHLEEENDELASAIPALVWRCLPKGRGMIDNTPAPKPQAIVACNRVAPELTTDQLREALRADYKEARRAAALAIRAILEGGDTQTYSVLLPVLVSSFALADDFYERGPAAADIARTLSIGLKLLPTETDSHLNRALNSIDQRTQDGAFRAYQEVFSRWRRDGSLDHDSPPSDEAEPHERLAFDRLFEFFCALPDSDSIKTVADFLQFRFRSVPWDLQVESVKLLLGTAALAADQLRRLSSGVIESPLQDPRDPQQQLFDQLDRQHQLSQAQNSSLRAVEWIISRHPSKEVRTDLLTLVSEMRMGLASNSDSYTSRLVELIGRVAKSVPDKPLALRHVYLALTNPSVAIRAGAARAYRELRSAFGYEGLPHLLHETFLALLMDDYKAVHSNAIDALGSLPDSLRPRAIQLVFNLVQAYAKPSDDYFDQKTLLSALNAFFSQLKQGGVYTELHGRLIVTIARDLQPDLVYDFVAHAPEDLRSAAGFGDLLLLYNISPEPLDNLSSRILELLIELPDEEIRRLADSIVDRGSILDSQRPGAGHPFLHALLKANLLPEAEELARRMIDNCGDGANLKQERLTTSIDMHAVGIELAAVSGDIEALLHHASSIRMLEREIAEDDETNRDRRGIFP